PAVIATIADFLFTANERVPDRRRPRRSVDLPPFDHAASGHLNVTWRGHSSLMKVLIAQIIAVMTDEA
ncbi:MAG: hypothetical protein PVG19_01770, partial [Desulfobacterales bacterium]